MDFTYQPVERYRAIMALLFITGHNFTAVISLQNKNILNCPNICLILILTSANAFNSEKFKVFLFDKGLILHRDALKSLLAGHEHYNLSQLFFFVSLGFKENA